jgi:isopenicillin-N N-acyltransferase like protein
MGADLKVQAGEDSQGMRCIVLEGSAQDMGRCHGETYREEIRDYAEDRVALSSSGSWSGRAADREEVIELAASMLPAHRAYSPDLCSEMEAMAEACDLTPAEAIIVGGFTDFVDAVRATGAGVPDEDDCTAVVVPDSMAGGQGYLAQTWDMHASATEHVTLLDIRPQDGPRSFVFSTVGCLGQIGINEAGIAIGINNLAAEVGARGVTWPLVIRKALLQTDIEAALRCITQAPLAGAHHYLLLDGEGRGFDVEAMPQGCAVRVLGEEPLIHTNHCLDPGSQAHEAAKPPALMASSQARLDRAKELLDRSQVELADLMALTRDPQAICQVSKPPYHIESSGAAIMRPGTREMWAVWGLPSENEYDHFKFSQ